MTGSESGQGLAVSPEFSGRGEKPVDQDDPCFFGVVRHEKVGLRVFGRGFLVVDVGMFGFRVIFTAPTEGAHFVVEQKPGKVGFFRRRIRLDRLIDGPTRPRHRRNLIRINGYRVFQAHFVKRLFLPKFG